jgi:hypothetical protein
MVHRNHWPIWITVFNAQYHVITTDRLDYIWRFVLLIIVLFSVKKITLKGYSRKIDS